MEKLTTVVDFLESPELSRALSDALDRDDLLRLATAQREKSWNALLRHLDAATELSVSMRTLKEVEQNESSNSEAQIAHWAAVLDGRANIERTALSYFGSLYREKIIAAVVRGNIEAAVELIEGFEGALETHRKLLIEADQS